MFTKVKILTVLTACLCSILFDARREANSVSPTCKQLVKDCMTGGEKGCNVWSKVAALYNPRHVCQKVLDVIKPLTKDPSTDYLPGCIAGCDRTKVFHFETDFCTGPCL